MIFIGARARSEARQRARLRRAIRASVRFSSTPTTWRKGSSAASSIARPIPAPTSMKLISSNAQPGRLLCQRFISVWKTEGATP